MAIAAVRVQVPPRVLKGYFLNTLFLLNQGECILFMLLKGFNVNIFTLELLIIPNASLTKINKVMKITKPNNPSKLVLLKGFDSRPDARKREKYLNSGFGKEFHYSI